ncbi:gamma-tubulin complex component 6 [Malaya genurostris]|uniref:gamma-tubulin complex component 6 n=1 Tax=Malaya genurostris TaxID=325434 RepID=UPI0026F3D6B1|nr:gamma-tubulin complex component 6 [Malaya genurostris]
MQTQNVNGLVLERIRNVNNNSLYFDEKSILIFKMSAESVHELIGSLIYSIGRESPGKSSDGIMKKCKSLAFGILLGKRSATASADEHHNESNSLALRMIMEEPIEMLHCHLFEMQLRSRYQFQKRRCEKYDELLEQLELDRLGGTDAVFEGKDKEVLQFLLLLRDSVPDGRELSEGEAHIAGDWMPSTRLGPYPIFQQGNFQTNTAKLNAYYRERTTNPYCLKKSGQVFSENVSNLLNITDKVKTEKGLPQIDSTFISDPIAELVSYQGPFKYNMMKGSVDEDEQLLTSFEVIPSDLVNQSSVGCCQRESVFNFNWENLGNRFVPVEQSFATECNAVLHLTALGAKSSKELSDIKVVRNNDFLRDVKSLLTGISSRCFYYDNNNRFSMVANFTVDSISPVTMKEVVDQFIQLGTCFRRLQKMTKKNPYNHAMLLDGFVFKAFCDSVEKILSCFRVVVNSYEGCSLLHLQRLIEPMKKQILALAKFCGIHPDHESDKDFPIGSVFLDHLYKELIQITCSDVSCFLLHILKHCCYAYFLLFQQWLFGGQLRDPSGELFIYFVNHYRPKTKHFFDKAFLIRRQAVPGFLKGFEEDVLLCGKYTMLLKAFRPTHPIFSLKIPKLEVCLSYSSVDKLKNLWLQYVAKAREICGLPVSVRQLYEKKERDREQFLRLVEENFRRSMTQWRMDQDAEAEELRLKKQRQREELLEHLNEIRESKQTARKQEIVLEMRYQVEQSQFEKGQLLAENLEREKVVEGYKELNRIMDEKRKRTEAQVNRLKVELTGDGLETADSETEFESCVGGSTTEDESASFYEDAQKSPLSDRPGELSNEDEDENTIVEKAGSTLIAIGEIDLVNCNDVLNEFERNKQRVLGSNIGNYFSEDHENANIEEIKETVSAGTRQLTEAQRNKIKILSQEYGFGSGKTIEKKDLNCNEMEDRHYNRQKILISDFTNRKQVTDVATTREPTELERNRMKIMSQEYNVIVDDHDRGSHHDRKPEMYLNLDSDRAINRKRVLECEYNILTGAQNFVDTPMSVDSDTFSEDLHLPLITINGVPQDINANPLASEGNMLRLNMTIAQEEFNESRFGVPDTAMLAQETPESALNTAGLEAKQGFEFPDLKKSCSVMKLDTGDCCDEDEIYKDFMEALKKRDLNLCELASMSNEVGSLSELRQLDSELRSVDVLTVTRFLQSSLVIPLKAHMQIVNSEIMKMCLNDLDILGHFESLRNYFLLMDGEFSCYICDNLFILLEEVRSPDELLNYQTLHTILDSALCSSAAGADKNADRLSFNVEQIPECFELFHPNAISMLNLSYRVEWPLNLILNPETIEQYTNIFKYLVKVRRVSFVLGKSFQLLKEVLKQFGKRILGSPQYSRVQLISHKLSHLVNALKNYITSSALQASWETFRKDLETAESMEDLYRKHTTYIKRILFLCLLNKKSLEFYNNMEDIFRVVLRFYKHLKSKAWRPQDKANPTSPLIHPKYAQILTDEGDFEKLIKYTIYLGNKMYDHGYQKEIHEFINVININGYYSATREGSQ